MPLPRVLVLYNQPVLPRSHPDAESEYEIIATVGVVESALSEAGFPVERVSLSHDPAPLLPAVKRFRPDVVFNLFEGTGDDVHTEADAAGLLHWMKIPYTGCTSTTLALARCKHLTKHVLRSAGLPTADFQVVEGDDIPQCTLDWPVIVKPAQQDGSVGLDHGSVVLNQQQLKLRVQRLLEKFGPPVLMEEFIDGREFNAAIVEIPDLSVLPISEILFNDNKPGSWPIVTYDAKWKPESDDFIATPSNYEAKLSPRLAERLSKIAIATFRLMGCRDYARVDFRVRPGGKAYILELNPNPDFSPDAGLSGALESTGMNHAQFTVQLVWNALARSPRAAEFARPTQPTLQTATS